MTEQSHVDRPDFDRDAAERILRRAIDLVEGDVTDDGGISEAALVEAADELGVDVSAVRRAASEERLGVLAADTRRGDRLVGPAVVTATRVVDGTSTEALELIDRWLRRHGALRRQRRDDSSSTALYTRRSDLVAGVQRAVRSITGEEQLGRVRRLSVAARPLDANRTVVALSADLSGERTAALATGTSIAGAGSAVSVVEALVWTPWIWLGVPASIAAGTGVLVARSRGVPDIEVALHGVLDRVAADDAPGGVLDDVRHRILGGLSRDSSARRRGRSAREPGPST